MMNQNPHKSIVVVDDTPENLRLLADMLSDQGYRVRLAPNGERALATVQKERPDLILMDIIMPEMDGFEVCRQLKANQHVADIPIIFISALSEVFDKVTAFAVGGVDYITKPFQIEEVLARVQTHLSLKAMQDTLEMQNRALQEQNYELEAFAHTVAHDLKNPLATILGALDLVREDATCMSAQAQELLGLTYNGSNRMRNIIDELLLLASVRREDVTLHSIDLGTLAGQAVDRLTDLVQRYKPEIRFPMNWPAVSGYGPWVEEVLVNYISNALKYGGQPPIIELGAAQQDNGMVRIWVRDNGAGMDEAACSQLFTEFTRFDKVRAEGHGLGLSIVRRIMGKLGGGYGVESAPGDGSLFYITLPSA
jgi:signal transduction histidine kinase